jgi:hypothetical protein
MNMVVVTGLSKKEEGGCCVPGCRYYPEYGRIEDVEVIKKHRELEEEYRKCNEIVNIDISANGVNYNKRRSYCSTQHRWKARGVCSW